MTFGADGVLYVGSRRVLGRAVPDASFEILRYLGFDRSISELSSLADGRIVVSSMSNGIGQGEVRVDFFDPTTQDLAPFAAFCGEGFGRAQSSADSSEVFVYLHEQLGRFDVDHPDLNVAGVPVAEPGSTAA